MLVKSAIKGEIVNAFTTVMNQEENRQDAIDKVADKLADAVIGAIKSVTITYTAGLVSPTGPVTGVFTCTIS